MYSLPMFTPIAPIYMVLHIFMQMFIPNYPKSVFICSYLPNFKVIYPYLPYIYLDHIYVPPTILLFFIARHIASITGTLPLNTSFPKRFPRVQ